MSVPDVLARIRFRPEHELIAQLFERFGLEVLIEHFILSGQASPMVEVVLASQLRITPVLSPRLTGLLDEARRTLGFAEPVELFVSQDAHVNAAALHSLSDEQPHIVSLTSALVERMNDDELRYVLGHELGHLGYGHYRARLAVAAFGEDDEGERRIPPLLARRLESWDRLAELSADRAGLTVVGGRLDVAVSVFFKLESGLGPEHLRFDVGAFLDQLARLQKLERRQLLSTFSHPATPIRVRALQLFAGRAPGEAASAALDAEVAQLARLMDFEASLPLEVHARDFLLAGGLLAASADGGDVSPDEWEALVALLLPLSADPEAAFSKVDSAEEAHALLTKSTTWLRQNAGEERFALFRELAHVVCVDGRLLGQEQHFMHDVAAQLDIPPKAADEILFDVLANYLQAQAVRYSQLRAFQGSAKHPGKGRLDG